MTAPQEQDTDAGPSKRRAQPGTVKLYVSSSILSVLSGVAASTGTTWVRGNDALDLRDARLSDSILRAVKLEFVEKRTSDDRWERLGDTLELQLRAIRDDIGALREQGKDVVPKLERLATKIELFERERNR